MRIVDLSIRRPVTVFIFAVAAVVFGVVAFRNLAVNLLPDISYPSLTIRTTYEGTAPVEIESLLTRPIENAVGVVNNVVRVTSSSRADVSEVTLEFAWDTNMDFAALDVRPLLEGVAGGVGVQGLQGEGGVIRLHLDLEVAPGAPPQGVEDPSRPPVGQHLDDITLSQDLVLFAFLKQYL